MDAALQNLIWERAQGCCEYCWLPQVYAPYPFEIDHIFALAHGGLTVVENLALACFPCNNFKGTNLAGIDPTSGRVVPLFHPRRHKWREHFRWDGPLLVGRSSAGRVTIAVLRINLPARLTFRQTLRDEGVFPPWE